MRRDVRRMSIAGIIPARAGSKRVPGKNTKELDGKPLIMWTIEAAQKCFSLSQIIVSSDDDKVRTLIKGHARWHRRPKHLATDDALTIDVLHDILKVFHTNSFCLLQPTSPFRTPVDIDHCCDLHKWSNLPVISVSESDPDRPNGAVYVGTVEWLKHCRNEATYTYPFDLPGTVKHRMSTLRSLDIDTEADFSHAEHLASGMKDGWYKT